nr:MAG TPA: ParB protein [Caudoviricetes sp.]
MIDTDKIKPYHRNVRFNDETVLKLCEIIPKVGFNVPILVDKNNVIIKGHSRWKAGVRLGFKKLPCIISENDEETNRLDRLTDNKIQEFSKWDIDLLKVEASSINLEDIDLSDFGFDLDMEEIKMPETPSFSPVEYDSHTEYANVAQNANYGEIEHNNEPSKEFITQKDVEKTVSVINNEYGSVTCPKCGNVVLYKK